MTDAFRDSYLGLIEAARSGDSDRFANHVRESYELATQAPMAERESAVEAIGPVIAEPGVLPGAVADLAIVAGALVETGARPGRVGLLVLRELSDNTAIAVRFVQAWESTGEDAVIEPEYVTTADEERVAQVLGPQAGRATMAWWTSRRFAAAGVSMLTAESVREDLSHAPTLLGELLTGAQRLAPMLPEFAQLALDLAEIEPVPGAVEAPAPPAPPVPSPPPEPGEPVGEPVGEPGDSVGEPEVAVVWSPPGAGLVPRPPASAAPDARWGLGWRDRAPY